MKLDDLAAALGCSRAAASMVRGGKYERPGSDLPTRYAALVRLIEAERAAAAEAAAGRLCYACPREDCTGCRVADVFV